MIVGNKEYKIVHSTKGINCKKCSFNRNTELFNICKTKANIECGNGRNWFEFKKVIIKGDLIDNNGQISLF